MKKRRKTPSDAVHSTPANRSNADGTLVINQVDQLKALAHPLRQELFERFATAPATTKQVADYLGYKPTRLYHHVSTLEKAGLIRLVSTRPVRGTTEKYYSAVAKKLSIDPSLLSGKKSEVDEAGLGVLDGIFGKVRNDVAELLASGESHDKERADEVMFAQVELSGNEQKIREIRAKLDQFMENLAAECADKRKNAERSEKYRLLIGWYPRPNSPKR